MITTNLACLSDRLMHRNNKKIYSLLPLTRLGYELKSCTILAKFFVSKILTWTSQNQKEFLILLPK